MHVKWFFSRWHPLLEPNDSQVSFGFLGVRFIDLLQLFMPSKSILAIYDNLVWTLLHFHSHFVKFVLIGQK